MPRVLQLRRYPTPDRQTIILAEGEPCFDLTEKRLYIGDGLTPGGVAQYAQGLNGEDGAPGESAYEIAVSEGYPGTEQDWLAEIMGMPPNGTPSPTDPGIPGQMKWDADFLYVCTAPNVWKRTPLSSWTE